MINEDKELIKGKKYLDQLIEKLKFGDLIKFKSHNQETKNHPYQFGRFVRVDKYVDTKKSLSEQSGYGFSIQNPNYNSFEKIWYPFYDGLEGNASQSKYIEKVELDDVLATFNELYSMAFRIKKFDIK